jgi:hypothetical protein
VPNPNALRWDRSPGHYEVYYLTFTDPATGVGVWIRYTMVAPFPETGEPSSASLWFLAMDPRAGASVGGTAAAGATFGRKASYEIGRLVATSDPFRLQVGDAVLTDGTMSGSFDDVSWDLRWAPGRAYEHVHPLLRGIASTILVLPHGDVALHGSVSFAGRRLELDGARGGQAHLWGAKHASRWAWVHCNDFRTPDGEPVPDTFVDGVSVIVPRFGRELGPNTPFVGRVAGRDFRSTSAVRVLSNSSTFTFTSWRFEAVDGYRKLVGEVDADPGLLAGVTYHDPDGELAYCYNSEAASIRLNVYERAHRVGGWTHATTLVAEGRAHFEYAQRTPLPDMELLTS